VMNGFQKEVRDRMLSVLPHVEIYVGGETRNGFFHSGSTLLRTP